MADKKIAIILVRSIINVHPDVRETLDKLKLRRKNACVIYPETPSLQGMLRVVKDFVTWGEISGDVEKKLSDKMKGNVCHLHPPRGGYGRNGIKKSFTQGGALGDRKDKINNLIEGMI